MHPVVSLIAENVLKYYHLFVPLLFLVLGSVANVHGPVQHSLLVTTVSWALIWIPSVFGAGIWSSCSSRSRKITSWAAGGFLALSQICDRAACDKEGVGSTKVGMTLKHIGQDFNTCKIGHTSSTRRTFFRERNRVEAYCIARV
jgi:uncharacterized membrane protein YoaK (UPF0700 family)